MLGLSVHDFHVCGTLVHYGNITVDNYATKSHPCRMLVGELARGMIIQIVNRESIEDLSKKHYSYREYVNQPQIAHRDPKILPEAPSAPYAG